jgi:hypothetical protein
VEIFAGLTGPLPQKLCHLRLENGRIIDAQSREAMMKKVKYSEEQIIGVLSDLLQLEGKIRRHDGKRCKETKATGG